ncbi:tRNA-specific adenosine deaminase, partial [Mycobacterium sp. ITM-2017-0098]
MAVTDDDLEYLRRCVDLAREALDGGDEPNGSVRFQDHNRVKDGDATRHPEFAIARWAVDHLTPGDRARAT